MTTSPANGKGNRALRRIDGRTRLGLPLNSMRAALSLPSLEAQKAMLQAIRADVMRNRRWTTTLSASWADALRILESETVAQREDPAPIVTALLTLADIGKELADVAKGAMDPLLREWARDYLNAREAVLNQIKTTP